MVLRSIFENNLNNIEIKHINNKSKTEVCSNLIRYDSIHGKFNHNIDYDDIHLIRDKLHIANIQI